MSTPAGWYPQPDGQQRYWDGERWTENVAPGVPPVTPPVAARKNWFLRHKVITAIGAVLLLGMFAGIANGSGTKSVSTVPVAAPVATSTTPDQAALNKAAADKAAAAKAAADKAAAAPQLGKTVRDGKFAFTVTAVKCGIAQVGTNVYLIKKAQGQFCQVSLKVENVGNEAQMMFASNQYLFDPNGRKFSADPEANIYDDTAKLVFENINPGNSINGYVYFDVPKGTKVSKLELHDSMFSGGITVRL
jgi:Domain of unknown function (DUF4352)/Protein of unknown function (DUF2510)